MFTIRKLQGTERFDAHVLSSICFHGHEDAEAKRAEIEASTVEDWGAFDADGTLAARIVNNKYTFHLDGHEISAGGIGGVSTLPEYRMHGAVKEIFAELLKEAYRNGEVISGLYPFKHAFYRKRGYETITQLNRYELTPQALAGYSFSGKITRRKLDDPVEPYMKVYAAYSARLNLAATRDEKMMLRHIEVTAPTIGRRFTYLFSNAEQDLAYVVFDDRKERNRSIEGADLWVSDLAWANAEGFYAILGFLSRMSADYSLISLPLPYGIDLLRLIRTDNAYAIRKNVDQGFMVRVINAEKLLSTIRKPAGCDVVIRVEDELLEENNGTWRVTETGAEKTAAAPDLILNERALAQLALGALNMEEAALRQDVTICGNEDKLRALFIEKVIYVTEHF